jgi:hypothetical protein
MRKKEPDNFKINFRNVLTASLCNSVKDYSNVEAKIAYWTTYFNNCKIKNRGNSDER